MGRILIADDEKHILEVMVDILEAAGHQVIAVADGQEALFHLQSSYFDIAVLDVMMPKLDGYHLAQAVHGLQKPPAVVIVTSRDFDGDKQALTAAGAAAFLPKPFSNKDLIEVIAKLLKERGSK
jgi:two-component system, OmpR family, response regulator